MISVCSIIFLAFRAPQSVFRERCRMATMATSVRVSPAMFLGSFRTAIDLVEEPPTPRTKNHRHPVPDHTPTQAAPQLAAAGLSVESGDFGQRLPRENESFAVGCDFVAVVEHLQPTQYR